jgi:hypothetical protein
MLSKHRRLYCLWRIIVRWLYVVLHVGDREGRQELRQQAMRMAEDGNNREGFPDRVTMK